MIRFRPALGCLALLTLAGAALPDSPADKPAASPGVSYYKDVRRVFQQHCQGCHQPARAMGNYAMTTHAGLLKPGESGKAPVVPGQPDKSELLQQVLPLMGKKPAMPKNRDALPPADVELLRRWIAEGAKDDTPRTVQDAIDEKNPPKYNLPPVLTAIDFSPDGNLLAVAGYHEILLHKADGSGLVARFVGLSERVQSLAFSPDGKQLAAAGGSPGRFGELQVWNVEKRRLRYSVSVTFDTLYGVSWSPDGSVIAFGCGDNTLRAIDAATGKQVLFQGAHSDWVIGTTFTQDGEHVISISRDMSMKLTVVKTQRFVDNITSITPGALKGGLQAVDRRHQAKQTKVKGVDTQEKIYDEVAVGGSDGTPRLYKVHRVVQRVIGDDANKVREYEKMPGRVFALRFNKEGTWFAAGSSLDGKGELRVYETGTGKVLSKLDNLGPVYTVAVHPSGKTVASAGFDGTVRLSDPTTGKVVKEFVPVPLEQTTARK
jgi:dipeptidyl aminopeptidase/acylaminoacyl peptidase